MGMIFLICNVRSWHSQSPRSEQGIQLSRYRHTKTGIAYNECTKINAIIIINTGSIYFLNIGSKVTRRYCVPEASYYCR